jgi:precorrin-4/cobalt-precorrin-4 C11-methyltransferase
MSSGKVTFVGAGPGAADLLTLRAAAAIGKADVIIWASSLVQEEVLTHARPDARIIDSAAVPLEAVITLYEQAVELGWHVARIHSGDPSLWGAMQEQLDRAASMGLEVEVIPGVSSFSAAAAAIGRELTIPEVAQSVILTRLEGGKTPMPPRETVRDFARHGTTMALFLSAARSGQLQEELLAGGYPPETPVVVAYREHKLWKHTLVLVGPALSAGGTRSHLYHPGHFHGFRRATPEARRRLRAEGTG